MANINQNHVIAILPLGAHEYHGQHLPLETDAIIAQAFAQRLAEKATKTRQIKTLPVEEITYSIEHAKEHGTKSLSYHQAIERWIKIGETLFKQGIKKLLLLNAHGGNSPLMTIVATELRCRLPMLVVATSWSRFGMPKNIIAEQERHLDIHAGFIETALMLYIASDKVAMQKAEDFSNKQADYIKKFKYLRAYGPQSFGWKMHDLNEKGCAGNAKAANAKAGKAIFDHAFLGLSQLVDDMFLFDCNEFDN